MRSSYLLVLLMAALLGCSSKKKTLFNRLISNQSGIRFSNTITESENDSTLISEFAYMGGGIGIGDFNNDGLKDIFFSANQRSSKLYLNKGHNQFEDITERAGVSTQVWATGVSIVDINNDGYDDIYVCVFGKNLKQPAKNLLFINQHNLTFKEAAAEYGLGDSSYSTQAVFFDYDKDGDLDMYLLNYRLNGPANANAIFPKDLTGNSPANDKLYRNDSDKENKGHPHFTDVSKEAGIREDGYGLGVSVADFNGDNWLDIYVSNDFLSNDELWLNNKNGTFTNTIKSSLKHQSYSSMGSDAADINNDGRPDIATVDMMPEYNDRKKLTYSFMNYERYEAERSLGYEPEFMRNMLQLNNGIQKRGDTLLPFFSEIGQLAGLSETDWSWSVLMADFNNDGWKDVHITNGIGRDYINADFIQFAADQQNTGDAVQRRRALNKKLSSLEPVTLSNYLYLNNWNYTFTNFSAAGGIDEPSLSSGAAYADLDNDGDLDLVVNNIDKEAFVFINNTIEENKPVTSHFLRVNLKGQPLNPYGYGSKVKLYSQGGEQIQEQMPVRGYLSSVDRTLIFGLGNNTAIDSLVVTWPNNQQQTITNLKSDQTIILDQSKAIGSFHPAVLPSPTLFTDITGANNIAYKHLDVPYNDFARQRLLPQKFSQLGPFLTTGDVNKDGLTDFFAGGGFNSTGKLFLQGKSGSFEGTELAKNRMQEDAASLFFDADGDGDQDLLITYGDVRYADTSGYYKPRLYLNDGKGHFSIDEQRLPPSVRTIAGCAQAADYDGDGDLDLFIGGRVSKTYPAIPQSFLLQNNGGFFTDVTATVAPQLSRAGMLTAAVWTDIDNDKLPELILAGDWMPIRFFKFQGGRLNEITNTTGLEQNSGMWRSLIAADIDGDGDTDLVAGNLGQNCKYHISPQEPMQLFAKDIDGNGIIDPVPFYYIRDEKGHRQLYPGINRDLFAQQVPSIKKQFLKHQDYATASFRSFFKEHDEKLTTFTCNETSSCYFENLGHGHFKKHLLPAEAQFAPVNAIICDDLDGDGIKDLLLAGNEYQTEVMTGRYDASYGLFLKGNKGKFKAVPPVQSGFIIQGDVRSMAVVQTQKEKLVIAAVNNDSLRTFKVGLPNHPKNKQRDTPEKK